jgi:hypothetical protein
MGHCVDLLLLLPLAMHGNVRVCVCVYVPVSLCLRPMRHSHTGACVWITDVCVYLPDSHVSGLSVSSCSYVLA